MIDLNGVNIKNSLNMSLEIAKGKGIKCNVVVSRAISYIINL